MLDTLKYSKVLEAVGISREQAEAHLQIITEIVEGDLATKQDIQRLEHKLVTFEHRLVIKLGALFAAIATLCIAVGQAFLALK